MRIPPTPDQTTIHGGRSALVIATSASTLSRSLKRGGWTPRAIDGFGDLDTRDLCDECHVVPYGDSGFDRAALQSAIDRAQPTDIALYGGGLDSSPEAIEYLACRRLLLCNDPETIRLAKGPQSFFDLLATLGIPFPETRFEPPDDPEGWLAKYGHSEGGAGVSFASEPLAPRPDRYFQRLLPEPSMSALFLANSGDAHIIGLNTQWTIAADRQRPFRFAGAINRTSLSQAQRDTVCGIVRRLIPVLRLRGLNSLDFMSDGQGQIRVLEINPRPSATMALYDDDFPTGLAQAHLDACRGRLPEHRIRQAPVRAFRILYAPHDVEPETTLEWPTWCRDRPAPGCRSRKDSPLCTVTAEGQDEAAVRRSIQARENFVLRLIAAPRTTDQREPDHWFIETPAKSEK